MALSLANLLNLHLFLGREDGVNADPTQVPTVAANGTFNNTLMTLMLNNAIKVFLARTGQAPELSDRIFSAPITAGLDYALPSDLTSLARIEYSIGGAGPPRFLRGLDFTAFDNETSGGLAVTSTGYPFFYREPFAGKIRLWPQPAAGNVKAGDKITIYYSSSGNTLVNPTDVPGFPEQFHSALVDYVLIKTWRRKQDMSQSDLYRDDFDHLVREAKAYIFNQNRSTEYAVGEDVETVGSINAGYF